MAEVDALTARTPAFSVIIAVYNDWVSLERCLRSLDGQMSAPAFEVVVADDGSISNAPSSISKGQRNFPLKIVRQAHQGISPARNLGIQNARGSLLVFVDADCILREDCLAALQRGIDQRTQDNYFQLRLIGDCTNLVGRAEELRLATIQNHTLQPDGYIRYLNTAGFAIRRARPDTAGRVFDPAAQRAEDTLLLANLMQSGKLPWFVNEAIVQHAIPLSLGACLVKDVRSAYLERVTYGMIAAKGVKFRVSHRERLSMLRSMWTISARRSIGRSAWFVLTTRQFLRFSMLLMTDVRRLRDPRGSAKSS
ncbi:MAG: glycosyltransferase family 2 protein [Candidatus Acidiferrum sp.]|jgi:glycosyltransferase involved in cell wall biosynthesis